MNSNPQKPQSKQRRLLISGGGTGGHILAGVAIAETWKKKFGGDSPILFIGAQGGLEERLVPQAGYPLEVLRIGTLNRVSVFQKLKTALQLPLSLLRSAQILLRFQPNYILGVGGYSSGPLVLMGRVLCTLRLLRAKIAILEQNSIPGLTNRILGRLSDVIFAAFPGTEKHFPGREVQVTGNPIRSQLLTLPQSRSTSFTLFIFGGSQGALGINSLVLESLPYLKNIQSQIRIIHQTGPKDLQRVKEKYMELGWKEGVRVEPFIDQISQVYAESSLLICRAGSSTLSEIAAIGRAAIFIPLPTAADNHQYLNAKVFTDQGAGFLLSQTQSTGQDLAVLIESLLRSPERIREVEVQVKRFSKPEAAMELVEKLALQK